MSRAEEKLARLVAAAMRALEWGAQIIDRPDAPHVRVVHPETRVTCAVVDVLDGCIRLRWASPLYEAGILAALEHVERRAA